MGEKTDYKALLSNLKSKLGKGEMSTLVGAGFSKNIDAAFPDWFELIKEMALFTEGRRIDNEFSKRFPRSKLKGEKYQEYVKEEIWNHISSVGPLKAASNYIHLKGFRESVDHIVEINTPIIKVLDGKRYLCRLVDGVPQTQCLTESDVASHQKLLNLPWNNIFTTNYDNLLESCIDINQKEDVEKMIRELNVKIEEKISSIAESQDQIDSKLQVLERLQENEDPQAPGLGLTEQDANELSDQIAGLKTEIKHLQFNFEHDRSFLQGLEIRSRNLNDIKRNFRTTIISSSELAIRKNQNIIKIHGSICAEEPQVFGFDGDPSKKYVISQEDYDSYPKKHEAFMQLMRISLLQESFCLFGFSGIDPNFLGWIGWVRDVIQKNPANTNASDKIYMIDVGEKDPDADKSLFYKNHQIAFIPLGSPECISYLKQETGSTLVDDSPKSRINLLLDYLSMNNIPNENKINYEVFKQNEYQSLWDNILYLKTDSERINEFVKHSIEISSLKVYNRIPQLLGTTDNSQQYFLQRFGRIYNEMKADPNAVQGLLKLSLLFLQEVYLPHSVIFDPESSQFSMILEVSEMYGSLFEQFQLIDLKDAVWSNDHKRVKTLTETLRHSQDKELRQEVQYQSALYEFYNLNFDNLKSILNNWLVIGHWAMKKAGLQSHFSIPDTISELRSIEQQTVQESIYKYHLLSFLYTSNGQREIGEDNFRIVRAIEKSNIKSFNHTVTRLLKSFDGKPKKLLPYGEGKFTVTTTLFSTSRNDYRTSLQMLYLWVETGHPLHLSYVRNLSVEEAYIPIKLAMVRFPEPAFFFALQFDNVGFLTRISQDMIYGENLEKVSLMADSMMAAFFNTTTPIWFKTNVLITLSEFINVLEPAQWQAFYLSVWEEEYQRNFLADDLRVHKQEFLVKGISLLTDTNIAKKIIELLLKATISTEDQQVKDNVIHFLYQFRYNSYLDELAKSTDLNIEKALFDELIKRLKEDVFFLFVLANISFSFSPHQFEMVKSNLQAMKTFHNSNPRLWAVILYFGDGDPALVQRVKDEIFLSDAIWDSGIDLNNTSYTHRRYFASLSSLRRYRKGKSLTWTAQEAKLLYEQMIPELDKIYRWVNNFDHSGEFREIIKEMRLFLEAEELSLAHLDGFGDVKVKVLELSNIERGSEQNIEVIFGENRSGIILEIERISQEIYEKDRLTENDALIAGLLYKLLLRKEPALPTTLLAISNWFYFNSNSEHLKKYKSQLELLLRSFRDEQGIETDLPSLQEHMIKLAVVLKKWEGDESLIAPVLDLLNTSRFNSIRYNLKAEISLDKR